MSKYPISREFYPYALIRPPMQSAKLASFMGSFLHPPGWLFCDPVIQADRFTFPGYGGDPVEALLIAPRGLDQEAPCLVYYHGGGFLFPAAGYHYKLAAEYAWSSRCRVLFVQYRLTPDHPFPIPAEDCYSAFCWAQEHADLLGIDRTQIGVGGDSAGGALAAAVCLMARDRGRALPLFQMLIYPATDRRMCSQSNRRFTDTPMWNSKLSEKMWPIYLTDPSTPMLAYASPMEATDHSSLPPAYIETAEFDCLHDEGLDYARALEQAGVSVEVRETQGTVHGYDIVLNAPTTRASVAARNAFLNSFFH